MRNNYLAQKLYQRSAEKREAAKVGSLMADSLCGSRTFLKGSCPMSCPHSLGTKRHTAWMVGWQMSFDRRYDGM